MRTQFLHLSFKSPHSPSGPTSGREGPVGVGLGGSGLGEALTVATRVRTTRIKRMFVRVNVIFVGELSVFS